MAETVVDLSNIASVDSQGDPDNMTLIVGVPDNSVITGINWDVTIQTFDSSWLSEARISFDNSSDLLSPEFTLQPGTGNFGGTQSFSGSVSDSVPILDGNLYLEFWESFEDLFDDTDAIYLPGSFLTIITEVGDDITGTSGDDLLIGTAADDFIDGLNGDDTLRGRGGDDTLQGGDDKDILIGGAGDDELNGRGRNDTLRGGSGDDLLEGKAGHDLLRGGTGDDSLRGGGNNDTLFGGLGNDTLRGSSGQDILRGGFGDDELTGGSSQDTFVLFEGKGTDTITDFDSHDMIGLAGGLTFDDLSFSGNDIIFSSSGEVLATLTGIDTSSLSADDFTEI